MVEQPQEIKEDKAMPRASINMNESPTTCEVKNQSFRNIAKKSSS